VVWQFQGTYHCLCGTICPSAQSELPPGLLYCVAFDQGILKGANLISVDDSATSGGAYRMPQRAWRLLFLAWLASMAGTLGSLFFSEVMQLQPCILCWYQRIAMFPLVLVLGIGLCREDAGSDLYGIGLAAVGWAVAGYHVLLYGGWIPEDLQPCSKGLSCAQVDLRIAGFLTIPLMSLFAFTAIIGLLVAARRQEGRV